MLSNKRAKSRRLLLNNLICFVGRLLGNGNAADRREFHQRQREHARQTKAHNGLIGQLREA